jgi:branched-chain amino acid transport system substrate-binding protein
MNRRLMLKVAAAVVAVVTVTGCADSAGTGAQGDDTINVGVILPLSGPFSYFGKIFRDAIRLRFDQEHGKINGHPVKLSIVDDANDLATTQTKARQLVEGDHVSAVIGPFSSALMSGIAPYFQQKRVPAIAIASTPFEVASSGWVFCPQGSLAQISYSMGRYTAEELHYRTASLIDPDYIAGWRIGAGFAQGFQDGGGQVVQAQWAPLTGTDFSAYLSNIKKADVVASWFPATQVAFLQQFYSFASNNTNVVQYGNGLSEEQLNQLGDQVEGTVSTLQYVNALNTPESRKFVKAYEAAYGKPPLNQNSQSAYDAASVLVEAFKAPDATSDPDSLRKAILSLNIDTPGGPLKFDKSGFGIRDFYIVKATRVDGKMTWVPIKTYASVGPVKKPLDKQDIG